MHTPSSYMYSDLRSFGGITNKEAASELLTGQTLCGNDAPRDRINERTFLSRQIVHAAPSQVHPEFFWRLPSKRTNNNEQNRFQSSHALRISRGYKALRWPGSEGYGDSSEALFP